LLISAGYEALEAAHAADALAMLDLCTNIRAVVTDIEMPPGMNGLALARLIAERWESIAILIVSGRVQPLDAALPAGAQFMAKPIMPQDLLSKLDSMTGHERASQ